jgi:thioredoxin 2
LQEYADGRPTEVDDAGLTKQIGRSDIPVVIDFWATWCGPFRTMAPAFAQIASTLEPNVRFLTIDVDANPSWAAKLGVRGIPVLFGRVVAQRSGAADGASLCEWVTEAVAAT